MTPQHRGLVWLLWACSTLSEAGFADGLTTTTSLPNTSLLRRGAFVAPRKVDSDSDPGFLPLWILLCALGPLLCCFGCLFFYWWHKRENGATSVGSWTQAMWPSSPSKIQTSPTAILVGGSKSRVLSEGDSDDGEPRIAVVCAECRLIVQVGISNDEKLQYICPNCHIVNQLALATCGLTVKLEACEALAPSYWTSCRHSTSNNLIEESDSMKSAAQTLLDKTWNHQITRDRPGGAKAPRFEVAFVHRNENFRIWDQYARRRAQIEEISHGIEHFTPKTQSEDLLADTRAAPLLQRAGLKSSCNEFYLFHGTTPSAAQAICEEDFLLNLSGSHAGTLYGPGFYFAEASTKSDEYAEEDEDGTFSGLYAILLCRVVCGNMNYTDEAVPKVSQLVDSILTDKTHHAVLGDREKCRGTYREFIVFDKDQVYPEYVIVYKRVEVEGISDSE